jgi:hypothetical protein
MFQYIEAFDKCFKERGGHFDHKILDNPIMLEFLLKGCRRDIEEIREGRPDLPEVYFDFINNSSLNACAAKMDGKYFIGIHIGTFFLLSDLFLRMLSNKNVLSEFGDTSHESDSKKIFNAQITDTTILFLAKDPNESISPKDPVRLNLAQLLTSFAIKFLVMHEYGHIIFGHLDYLESKTKVSHWTEIEDETLKLKSLSPITSQTLEMDADSYAVLRGVRQIIFLSGNIDNIKQELKPFYSSLESSLTLWFYSIYSLFRLFGYSNCDPLKIKKTLHPQTGIRQHIVFATTHTILQNEPYKELLKRMPSLAMSIVNKVEKAFEEISFQGYDSRAIKIAYEKESQEHVLELVKNWNNVRPELEKYAKGKLAPMYVPN